MAISPQVLKTIKSTLPAVAQAGTGFTSHFYKRMFKALSALADRDGISFAIETAC